jgi:hypothetical protein
VTLIHLHPLPVGSPWEGFDACPHIGKKECVSQRKRIDLIQVSVHAWCERFDASPHVCQEECVAKRESVQTVEVSIQLLRRACGPGLRVWVEHCVIIIRRAVHTSRIVVVVQNCDGTIQRDDSIAATIGRARGIGKRKTSVIVLVKYTGENDSTLRLVNRQPIAHGICLDAREHVTFPANVCHVKCFTNV